MLFAGIAGTLIAGGGFYLLMGLMAGFFAAMAVALIWLIWLDRTVINNMENKNNKVVVRALIIVLLGMQVYISVMSALYSERQADNLVQIRATLFGAIAQSEIENVLIHTLKSYHHLNDENAPIGEMFRNLYSDRIHDDGTFELVSEESEEAFNSEFTIHSPDSIRLTIAALYADGTSPEFANIGAAEGVYQATAILTPGGVSYEREN